MAWYDTGTLTLTEGSKIVTGSGTDFVAGALVGSGIVIGGLVYGVDTVEDATHLTLLRPWPNATATGVLYGAFPTSSLAQQVLTGIMDLLDSFGPFRGATADFNALIASKADQIAEDHDDVVAKHAEVLTATATATSAATSASASQTAAAGSATAAAASEAAAEQSKTAAAGSATSASQDAASALASKTAAQASQDAAAISEANAAAAEATAVDKATIATDAATDADASADSAATSETNASTWAASANAALAGAQAARDAALAGFAEWADRNRGNFPDDASASAGTPPVSGEFYFNTTTGIIRFWFDDQWGDGYRLSTGSYLSTAGGALTGPLALAGNPTDALHATTKQYVDARSGVTSVAGKTGAVTLAKGDVGLGNVANTAPAEMPVSNAQAAAIAAVATDAAEGLAAAITAFQAAQTEARRLSFFLNRR